MILLNADLGEGVLHQGKNVAHKVALYIHLANVSCGAHAGNESHIKETIQICLEHNVLIGAHPSYPDKENFGRSSQGLSPDEILEEIEKQILTLAKWAVDVGTSLSHVKAHGALYNDLMKNPTLLNRAMELVKAINPSLAFVLQSGVTTSPKFTNILREAFVDRQYDEAGFLIPRSEAKAVFKDKKLIQAQLKQLLKGHVQSSNGKLLSVSFETLCIHCDNTALVEELASLSFFKVQQLNEDAFLISGTRPNEAFAGFLREHFPGFQVVPSYETVLLDFGAVDTPLPQQRDIEKVIRSWRPDSLVKEESILEIPVCYGLEIDQVADRLGLGKEEVAALHSQNTYTNFAMGFLPGFAYLGEHPEELQLPRKEKVAPVKAGTLAIAEKQTAIYPLNSPGGWHQIGRTPLKIFDSEGKLTLDLKTGQKIRFRPISEEEFFKMGGQW